MTHSHSCFRPAVLATLIGWGAGCTLVMDTDFDKYEEATDSAGAAGAVGGAAGDSGIGGMAGSAAGQAGAGGGCQPVLTINEIQTEGTDSDFDEYVELFNASDCPAMLEYFVLAYRSSSGSNDLTWSAAPGQMLHPWSFFVIAGPEFSGTMDAPLPGGLTLGAKGGGLAIRNAVGMTVDQMGWGDATNAYVDGEAAPAPNPGFSIGRVPDGEDSNNNLIDFEELSPSPGFENK